MAEHTVREDGDQNSLGRYTESRLESGFRPIPGGAHFGRFRAAKHGGIHGTGNSRCPFAAGQAGEHVAERADEVAGQVQDRLEQILHRGASQSLAALRERDLERKYRGKRVPGRTAALARVSQGTRCAVTVVQYHICKRGHINTFSYYFETNPFYFLFLRHTKIALCSNADPFLTIRITFLIGHDSWKSRRR